MSERRSDQVNLVGQHAYTPWAMQSERRTPLQVTSAKGITFTDETGKVYMDFSSQLVCSNLGHSNQAIIDAICEQARTLAYIDPGFSCPSRERAMESLSGVLPAELNQLFFASSGALANEAAIRIIRQVKASDDKYKIISRYRSYHGATAGSLALTGEVRRWHAEPMGTAPGIVFAPDPYCYRCPFQLNYPACNIQCAEYIEFMIQQEGHVAALFVEPIAGTNGVVVPPPEYLPRLREIADKHGVLLVVDEVMTGWYRTGKAFAVEHWGVIPDILTTAKGCTGAYTPVGVTATTSQIRDHFREEFFPAGHTYTMHPLALSAIPPAIEEYDRLATSGAIEAGSRHLRDSLTELARRHTCIGDIRGLGHFWGIELVQDRAAKTPFDADTPATVLKPPMTARLAEEMLKRGLYMMSRDNTFIVAPPLIATPDEIDCCIEIMDDVLPIADRTAS